MDSTVIDNVAKELARISSRRHVVRALAAGAGIGLLARVPAQGAPGIKPIRCFKRGDQCFLDGPQPCCGRLVCNPAAGEPDVYRCQKALRIGRT